VKRSLTGGEKQLKDNFKLLALKVVAVAYERWSLTRGSQCSDLTWKLLVFWKTGRRGEVVATGGSTVRRIGVVVRFPQTTQNLVISRCCFAEDGKKMYQNL